MRGDRTHLKAFVWKSRSISTSFYEPVDHVPGSRRDAFAEGLLENSHEHRAFGAPDVSAVGHAVLDAQNAGTVLMMGEFHTSFCRRVQEGDDALGIVRDREPLVRIGLHHLP